MIFINNLYNEYNKTLMTSFDFSDEELNAILTYIKDESTKEVQVVVADVTDASGQAVDSAVNSNNFYLSLGLNLFLLIVIIFILFRFTNLSKKYVLLQDNQSKGKLLDEDDKEIVDSGFNIKEFIKSNRVVGIASFLFIGIFVKSCIDGLVEKFEKADGGGVNVGRELTLLIYMYKVLSFCCLKVV